MTEHSQCRQMIASRKARRRPTVAVLAAISVLVTLCVTSLLIRWLTGPRASFRRFVIDPIPRSVHSIKAHSAVWGGLHGQRQRALVLRFAISREDLSRVVDAHELKPGKNTESTYGRLHYEMTVGPHAWYLCNIQLYRERQRPAPSWFDLDEWTRIETHVLERDTGKQNWVDVTLVLYHEQSDSAYFIQYQGEGFRSIATEVLTHTTDAAEADRHTDDAASVAASEE